jgi:hypothetical protein
MIWTSLIRTAKQQQNMVFCPDASKNRASSGTGVMNQGFQIGGVPIAGRVLTAPMTGVSELPFRRAA